MSPETRQAPVRHSLAWTSAIGLCLAGAIVSVALLVVHISGGEQGCVTGRRDCFDVVSSIYGRILGLPIPLYSTPYYVLIALLMADARFGGGGELRRARTVRWLQSLTVAGLLLSLALLGAAALALHELCPLCVTLDVINLLLVIATGRAARETESVDGWWKDPGWRWIAACAVALFIGMLSVYSVAAQPRPAPARNSPSPGVAARVGDDPVVTAVINPACSHCAAFWPDLKGAVRALAEAGVRVDLRVALLPPSRECFEAARAPRARQLAYAPGACRAAAHAWCASLGDRLVPYLDELFAEVQAHASDGDWLDRLDAQDFDGIARRAGLDLSAQRQCTNDGATTWDSRGMNALAFAGFGRHLRAQQAQLDALPIHYPQLWVGGRELSWSAASPARLADRIASALGRGTHR